MKTSMTCDWSNCASAMIFTVLEIQHVNCFSIYAHKLEKLVARSCIKHHAC